MGDPLPLQTGRDWQQAASHYDTISSRYEGLMEAEPANHTARDCFRALLARTLAPGSTVLDFGCGTGLDARWLAGRGHRVIAFDVSAGMIARLEQTCAEEIATGRVIPWCADYPTFLAELPGRFPVQAVVSNFSALNHLADLRPLFTTLAVALPPGGPVIAAVLNPFYLPDMTHAWWWGAFAQGIRDRRVHYRGTNLPTYRHYPAAIHAAAWPHFVPSGEGGAGSTAAPLRTHLLRQFLAACLCKR